MTWLRLNAGPSDGTVLEIAPTMRTLIYRGEKYFRMPSSRATDPENPDSYGGSYLWNKWLPQLPDTKENE